MNEVSARQRIALPISTCWEKLSDFSRAIDYVPGLTNLRVTTAQSTGIGASRVVVSRQAGPMDETITEWQEGKGFSIRLHRGGKGPMPPMSEASFEYALESAGEDTTDIVLRMRYGVRFGALGALLDALFLKHLMQRNLSDIALALADNYISNARVTPERLAQIRLR
ncbi:MAG: SRPBCC family protein [Myxococcota bacterium]|nr:SRPBCC family protein [Myxococcota bacterium]